MSRETIDASTQGLSQGGFDVDDPATRPLAAPCLTVLAHPDPRRIGERAVLSELLSAGRTRLSRREPLFAAPDSGRATPLADVRLSRTPLFLEAADAGAAGTVRLNQGRCPSRVVVDGVPLAGARELEKGELARGVVLELARHIALLLHRWRATPRPDRRRFGMVGDSAGIEAVRADIGRVAPLAVPVLLRGETGTGKELVAQAIHRASERGRGPFLALNLGALSPSLAVAELFGARKGAFTGAVRDQAGFFRRADGGTLLLDEIGEAPAEVQVMLLRALEDGEIVAAGSQRPRRVDVRVLAATDIDLEAEVAAGRFRAPLLHRLAGYEIELPPLRRRRDDVGRLLVHFLRQALAEVGGEQTVLERPSTRPWLPASLIARLARYDWPGNIRQLRNVAQQLVIAGAGAERLEISPPVERLLAEEPASTGASAGPDTAHGAPPVAEKVAPPPRARRTPASVSDLEIRDALRRSRWEPKAAAERLGISRASLYARIRKSPELRSAGDVGADELDACYRECGGDVEAMAERLEVSARALQRRLRELGLTG